jgi:hypothetical protein
LFDKYRRGIQPFAEDITSLKTRFGILRRMPADWWYENEEVEAYVQQKFEKHLFSEKQFSQEIVHILEILKEDLEGNENRLLASCNAAIESADLPRMTLPDYTEYENDVRKIVLEFGADSARDSVYNGIATFILAEATAIIIQKIISGILTTMGTAAATSLAASGGATVVGVTAGASAGTIGGPAGQAIGLGIGLVVGVLVDWWMTERFQENLTQKLEEYFNNLEAGLLQGADGRPGLKETLTVLTENLSFAQTTTIHRAMIGG